MKNAISGRIIALAACATRINSVGLLPNCTAKNAPITITTAQINIS